MKIAMLGSGSGGNASYVEENGYGILIDAGFSCKKIEERLASIGKAAENVKALLITHEHTDHISGAGVLARKYDIPIYISPERLEACKQKLGKIAENQIHCIQKDFFLNENIYVKAFDVMHDAVRTLGFHIETASQKKIAISTDIGYITNLVREAFQDVDAAILESNYDYNMLMNGPYPWDLKARVKGINGHLSNNDAAKFIREMYTKKLQKIFLAHVSKDSNHPNIIHETMELEFEKYSRKPNYEISSQNTATKLFEIK